MSNYLEQKGYFKGARNPVEYKSGKTSTIFYIDIDKDGEYPAFGEFKTFGDKIDLKKFEIGDPITVKFSISAREWVRPEDNVKLIFQDLIAFSMTNDKYTGEKVEEGSSPNNGKDPDKGLPSDDLPFLITIFIAVGSLLIMVI